MLGVRVTFEQLASLGGLPLLLVVVAVGATLCFSCALASLLGRSRAEGLLAGGAVAICGASAALAISAVLPRTKENEQFTLLTVVGVTSLSTLAMIVYPLLVHGWGLDATAAGIFIGGTIHDVAQVIGAGYLISNRAGEVATLVKLARVACLVPVVVAISSMYRGDIGTNGVKRQITVPFFLIGFALLMLANSFHLIPDVVSRATVAASRACLVIAIAALGVKTSFQSLAKLGWQPIAMLVGDTLWIALFVLEGIEFTR